LLPRRTLASYDIANRTVLVLADGPLPESANQQQQPWDAISNATLLKVFRSETERDGLTCDGFCEVLMKLGLDDNGVGAQLFDAFDQDASETLDFREMFLGLSLLLSGSIERRLRCAFDLIDSNGSGKVSPAELEAFLRPIAPKSMSKHRLGALVTQIIKEADTNETGLVDAGEFLEWPRKGLVLEWIDAYNATILARYRGEDDTPAIVHPGTPMSSYSSPARSISPLRSAASSPSSAWSQLKRSPRESLLARRLKADGSPAKEAVQKIVQRLAERAMPRSLSRLHAELGKVETAETAARLGDGEGWQGVREELKHRVSFPEATDGGLVRSGLRNGMDLSLRRHELFATPEEADRVQVAMREKFPGLAALSSAYYYHLWTYNPRFYSPRPCGPFLNPRARRRRGGPRGSERVEARGGWLRGLSAAG